jgi:type 1 glutamine amidotransferase
MTVENKFIFSLIRCFEDVMEFVRFGNWRLLIAMAGFVTLLSISTGCSKADESLHIHFISGSDEYQSEQSLAKLQQILEENFTNVTVTISRGEDAGDDLSGLEQLADADLMLVFTRRMTLPEDQLAIIRNHTDAEKPVIGIRTASHAFQGYLEFDAEVLGGDYDGHGDNEPVVLTFADGAESHRVLEEIEPWERPGKIYHNASPGPNTDILIYGEGLESGIHEPLAWTNIYRRSGRAFYTSMGLPSDFENENFLQMVINAISWTTERELMFAEAAEEEGPVSEEEIRRASYHTMDYGPVLSESIRKDQPEGSLVRKGLAIRLDHNTAMIFDTDLVRFSGGIADGWLDITETDYMSYKGSQIASVEGRQVFFTTEIAGWANDGSFYGPRDDGMGSLPRDWAHYKGFYRHGDQIVLSYTVNETSVLELPQAIKQNDNLAFVRNMQISSSGQPHQALLLEMESSWSAEQNSGREIIIDTGERTLAVLLANGSGEARITEGQNRRIELHLPPSETGQMVRVAIAEVEGGSQPVQELKAALEESMLPDLEEKIQGGPNRWKEIHRDVGHPIRKKMKDM